MVTRHSWNRSRSRGVCRLGILALLSGLTLLACGEWPWLSLPPQALGQQPGVRLVGRGIPANTPEFWSRANVALEQQLGDLFQMGIFQSNNAPEYSIYRLTYTVDVRRLPMLIWDDGAGRWSRVQDARADFVEECWRDCRAWADRTPSAAELVRWSDADYELIRALRVAGAEVANYLTYGPQLFGDDAVVHQVMDAAAQSHPLNHLNDEGFPAAYAFDYRLRAIARDRLRAIFDGYNMNSNRYQARLLREIARGRRVEGADQWRFTGPPWIRAVAMPLGTDMGEIKCAFRILIRPNNNGTAGAVELQGLPGEETTLAISFRTQADQNKVRELHAGVRATGVEASYGWRVRFEVGVIGDYQTPQGIKHFSKTFSGEDDFLTQLHDGAGVDDLTALALPEKILRYDWKSSQRPSSDAGNVRRLTIVVQDELDHRPLGGARLLVRRSGEAVSQAVRQVTDRTGRASMELLAGKYDVVASADRYRSQGRFVELTSDSSRETEIIILLRPTSDLPPPSPGKSLPVGIVVEDDLDHHPIGRARLLLQHQGDQSSQAIRQLSDRAGRTTVDLPPGRYDLTASAERYKPYSTVIEIATGRASTVKLPLRRQDVPVPAGSTETQVTFIVTVAGQPMDGAQVMIASETRVSASAQPAGNGTYVARLRPGQYTARVTYGRQGQSTSLSVGSRSQTVSVQLAGSSAGPLHPQTPVVPKRITVELSEKNRQTTVTAIPGDHLLVKVATYAGTGYRVDLVPPSQALALLVAGPRAEPMQRAPTTKLMVGRGTWQVYDFQLTTGARGSFRIAFRFIRPGQQRAEIEYAVTVQVSPARGS